MKRFFILAVAALFCSVTISAQNQDLPDNDWAQYKRYSKANSEVTVRPKAVLMGDSITDGWFSQDPEFFKTNNFLGRGISGQVTSHMLARFRRDVIDHHPKYVVILAGINDIARNNGYISLENTFGNIVSMCELAKANKIKPVLCTLVPSGYIRWRPAIKDTKGNVVAVVAADVNFEQMMSNVIGSGLGETGTTFVLGATRDLVAYSAFMDDVKEHGGLYNAFEDHFADPGSVLKKIDDCAFGNGEAFHATLDGREIYMTAREIPSTGWLLCTAINAEEITEPIRKVTAQSDQLFSDARAKMTEEFKALIVNAILAIAAIALIVAVIEYFISRTISKPIIKLTDTVKNTGEGDFDKKSDIDTRDEIGDLARGFNKMQDNLKLYTENLQAVTAEKERIGAELNVATKIQADMLPRIFPPFPQKKEIDLFASMTPAKEVGGDFYDFFLIDENHLALVIADVSGKGVPAALFMVISKTLIKNRTMQGGTPAQILADVNNQLCEGNDADMFVTCWLGIVDLSTGKMTAASAGHEFPAICGPDRKFELLKDKHGFVLAGMEGARYRDYDLQLEKGGSIFVYTDGVPEATNAGNEMFGTDRMLEALNRRADKGPATFLKEVGADVQGFTGEAPQFDDITMVGMTWYGNDGEETE